MTSGVGGSAEAGARGLISTVIVTLLLGGFAGLLWIGRWRLALAMLALTASAALLLIWRLYAGDAWTGPVAALLYNDLVGWLATGLLSLAVVLPLRRRSRPSGRSSRGVGFALSVSAMLLVLILLGTAFHSLVVQPFSIPASSMEPTIHPGDHVFAGKHAYWYGPYTFPFGPWAVAAGGPNVPKRGDVVVFRGPQNSDYIKRVVGLPGDRIQMRGGVLHINGQAVLLEAVPTAAAQPNAGSTLQRESLPGGVSYQVQNMTDGSMGDDTAEVLVPERHLFVMGDNRDNSNDSRFQLGTVPLDHLIGRAERIFWNSEGASYRERANVVPR